MVLVDRVIQLKSRSGESWESASGFLLNEGAVITAAHAVIGADPVSSIEARLFRANSWCKAFVAWSDKELDIALLQLVEPANPVTGAMPRWGQVKGTLAPVEAIGFPGFAVR